MTRCALFVDVQNIYYTTRQAFGRQFNYRKFWQSISEQNEIVLANAYAIRRQDDSQIKFQDALRHIGFDVKLKPFIQRSDGSAKGDWDVGITIDMMDAITTVDKMILLSGDGDFELLINRIKQQGVATQVVSVEPLTANNLIDAVDNFESITESLLL